MSGRPFHAYMLQCSDGSYYVGHTDDLERRMAQHDQGQGGRHTRSRLPVRLVWTQMFGTRDEAKTAEAQIKRWNRAKKESLIAGDYKRIASLASRGRAGRALRDALLRRTPQGHGSDESHG